MTTPKGPPFDDLTFSSESLMASLIKEFCCAVNVIACVIFMVNHIAHLIYSMLF
jgi:hypothetical protein